LSSTGEIYGKGTLGILLTGANKDGAYGMKKINDFGGTTIVQDPTTCMVDTMPKSAMAITEIDHVMNVDEIINTLKAINR
jgi:two-component system chemotaxis response regulator CheB